MKVCFKQCVVAFGVLCINAPFMHGVIVELRRCVHLGHLPREVTFALNKWWPPVAGTTVVPNADLGLYRGIDVLNKDCRRSCSAILTWVLEYVKISALPLNSIGN